MRQGDDYLQTETNHPGFLLRSSTPPWTLVLSPGTKTPEEQWKYLAGAARLGGYRLSGGIIYLKMFVPEILVEVRAQAGAMCFELEQSDRGSKESTSVI